MTETPQFDRRMLEALICPTTHTTLEYDSDHQELVSKRQNWPFPFGMAFRLCWSIRRVRLTTRPNASNTASLLCQGLRLLE